jgi:CRISPR type III-A-associated protein Csm2
MDEEVQSEAAQAATAEAVAPVAEPPKPEQKPPDQKPPDTKPRDDKPRRDDRPPRGPQGGGDRRDQRGDRPPDRNRENRGDDRRADDRRGDRREGGRPGGFRPFEGPPEIEIEKLISDSLYLDNQAHAVVARMRDMDSGTKSQLRRLYNAVRRAVRAPESERQHQFVMLRARLAYTIARHSLRSLDALEKLLLQVTRKNDARGYERFKDLFEAIVAYNE